MIYVFIAVIAAIVFATMRVIKNTKKQKIVDKDTEWNKQYDDLLKSFKK